MKKTLALLLCLVLVAALLPSAVTAFSVNNFWLRWDGDSSYVYTYPGGTATLKVVAYGDDLEGVTYQWYSGTYDYDLGDYPPIEGATSDTYVVENATEDQSFRCKAWDNYGNEDYVWLYVIPNNSFSLSRPDDVTSNVNVAPGSSAELRAIASGIDLEGVTYDGLTRDADGLQMYVDADNEAVLATSPSQTWSFYIECPMMRDNEDILPEVWEFADAKAARTIIARVDKHNYLILTATSERGKGISLRRAVVFFQENFKTEWVYDLDGGLSSALLSRKREKKNMALLTRKGAKVTDIMAFTE